MKAMCIDDTGHIPQAIVIPVGETVTVSQCPVYNDGYDVVEYPISRDGNPISYKKFRFIPLSDIDETEMIREYQTQTV